MKEKRLLKALGQVDADYIEEASPTQQTKRPRWMKWSVLAACLCLVVFSAIRHFYCLFILQHLKKAPRCQILIF